MQLLRALLGLRFPSALALSRWEAANWTFVLIRLGSGARTSPTQSAICDISFLNDPVVDELQNKEGTSLSAPLQLRDG
jgi:hypothetical protein